MSTVRAVIENVVTRRATVAVEIDDDEYMTWRGSDPDTAGTLGEFITAHRSFPANVPESGDWRETDSDLKVLNASRTATSTTAPVQVEPTDRDRLAARAVEVLGTLSARNLRTGRSPNVAVWRKSAEALAAEVERQYPGWIAAVQETTGADGDHQADDAARAWLP